MRSPPTACTPRPQILSLALFCWFILTSSASPIQASQHCSDALGQVRITQGEEFSGDLEILSWNIQKASNDGWAHDLAVLADEVNLAFIQEASVQAGLSEAINNPLYQTFAAGYATSSQQTGVMTLSTTSPSGQCSLTSWEPWLGTPKATSVTEFPLAGREDRLLTINLHAVNFALGLQDLRQQFRALAELLEQHQGPVILAGDLNTWSGQRQTVVDDFTNTFGLGAIAFSPDLRTKVFGRALDHIYIRGLQAQSAQAIPVTSSDHNPLRVRLALN